MNDLEDALHSTLHHVRDHVETQPLSGPALRRRARVHSLRVRTGGVVAVSAATVTGVVVAPSLLGTPAPRSQQSVGGAAAKTAGTDPAGKAQPSASFTAKPVPTLSPTKAPAAGTWDPAGALIADPTVLSVAPKAAATDADFAAWGGTLLEQSTVKVVFADREPIDSTWRQYPRPLVVVTGRTSAGGLLRVAALTTVAGGVDAGALESLTVSAETTVPADGPQAIAASDGLYLYVVAEAGVDRATYTYRDDTGEHSATMKVAGGVATALVPQADLKSTATGPITNVKAMSHGKVVWDAAPVKGR